MSPHIVLDLWSHDLACFWRVSHSFDYYLAAIGICASANMKVVIASYPHSTFDVRLGIRGIAGVYGHARCVVFGLGNSLIEWCVRCDNTRCFTCECVNYMPSVAVF